MKRSNLRQRVMASMSAHAYAQLITVGAQLLTLPIFIHFLSVEEYGKWLLISAYPAYLALSDLGVQSSAASGMTIASGSNNIERSREIFHSMLRVVSISIPSSTLLVIILWQFANDWNFETSESVAFLILCFTAMISSTSGIFDAIFRAGSQYSRITTLLSHARLIEWIGTVIGIVVHPSLIGAACGMAAGRTISQATIALITLRSFPGVEWGTRFASRDQVRKLTIDGLGIMTLLLSSILTLQGSIMIVGELFGPIAAAMFHTHRVLSRILVQVAAIFGKSISPELSTLYGQNDVVRFSAVLHRILRTTLLATTIIAIILVPIGPMFVSQISQGKVQFMGDLYYFLLVGGLASAAWQTMVIGLSATNLHRQFAIKLAVLTTIGLGLVYLCGSMYGIIGIAISLLIVEMATVQLARMSQNKFYKA